MLENLGENVNLDVDMAMDTNMDMDTIVDTDIDIDIDMSCSLCTRYSMWAAGSAACCRVLVSCMISGKPKIHLPMSAADALSCVQEHWQLR